MSKQSTDSARELRAKVTSKNGTTQAAIESFQEQNFEIIIRIWVSKIDRFWQKIQQP
jgi:pyrroline-5-carboxylate reductase